MISEVLDDIIDKNRNLTVDEAYECMDDLVSGNYPNVVVSSFLTALRMKGETIDEITGLTRSMKNHAVQIDYKPEDYLIETCGTGGDTFKTFNVSTVASIIASAGGAKISKHGNRSVSSKFGGADALEALGVNIELSPEKVINSIDKCNFAFIFAPIYHVATKNVMMIRKQLKTRTVFNLDEISNIGKTKVAFIDNGDITVKYITPEDFGLSFSKPEDIVAPETPQEHIQIIYNILNNVTTTSQDRARLDLCLMNSASILYLTKKVDSLEEGVIYSRKLIEDGSAKKQLEKIIKYSNE